MQDRFEIFTVLIAKINRNIRRIKNREMAGYELKSPHISCLYYLYSLQGLTATDLCEKCEEDKATISRTLDYLETNGYIVCESKTAKRYKSPILLTERGQSVGAYIAERVNCILDETARGLSEEERIAFYRSLIIISDSLEAIVNRTAPVDGDLANGKD